ncbi:MAG TPA: 4Fe-4S binding protein [Candidatus Binataceae bacterium]|nr:4Fe-4S binding protein [Candidatus Binataceae bacterium]
MGATTDYFRHIKDAVFTIFDGMAVSASHLIRRPYTIQYPDRTPVRVQDTLPFRYRGILDVDLEICTGCLACERACPIDCIVIVCEKNAQTRELTISQFDIDIAKCMYCGLCSEPCPTGSIHHTTEFEGADFSLESLIRRYVPEPLVAYKPKKGPEPDERVGQLLERGMRYVDEWAQPGGDKPPAAPAATAAAAAKPAVAAVTARPAPSAASAAAAAAKPVAAAAPAGVAPAVAGSAAQSADDPATAQPESRSAPPAGDPSPGKDEPKKDEPPPA